MAKLYFLHAHDPEQTEFAQRLIGALRGEHEILNDQPPTDPIDAAERVIFISSPQALSTDKLVNDLQRSLEKYDRTININWDSQRVAHPVEKLADIQWVQFEPYRKTHDETERERLFSTAFAQLIDAIGRQPPPHHAFMSYPGTIRPLMFKIVRALENNHEHNLNVWFDRDDIPPRTMWLDALNRGIEDAHYLVCFINHAWLASWGCNTEFRHAHALNKRIIAVYLEPLPPMADVIATAQNATDWKTAKDEQNIVQFIGEVYAKLPAEAATNVIDAKANAPALANWLNQARPQFNPDDKASVSNLPALPDELCDLITQIYNALQPADEAERTYLEWHTEYYMRARAWDSIRDEDQRISALLRDRELTKARKWLNAKRDPPPNALHLAFINAAQKQRIRRRRLFLITIFGAVIFVVALALVGLYVQGTEAELRRQQDVQAETNVRVQTLAQQDRRRFFPNPLPIRAERPLLDVDALWISDQVNGTLLHLALQDGAELSAPIPVGAEPRSAVRAGHFLWISARGGNTVTRVDMTGGLAPQTYIVGGAPSLPLITTDAVWVVASPGRTLYRIDQADNTITNYNPRDPNAFDPITDGIALWMVQRGFDEYEIAHFSAGARQPQIIALSDERPSAMMYADDALILTYSGRIERRDPISGAITALFAPNGVALTPVIMADAALWTSDNANGELIQLDAHTLNQRAVYTLPEDGTVRQLHITADRIFALTDATLLTLDRSGALINETAIIGAHLIERIVSDGRYLWLTVTQENIVFVVQQDNGTVFRDFQVCLQPLAPVFDGANMWFACRGEPRIVSMPAVMMFFGTSSFTSDNQGQQQPLVHNDLLWIVQEDAGRVLVIDGVQIVQELAFARDLHPLIATEDYLYTAYNENNIGTLIQIDPRVFTVQTLELNGAIHGITPIEDNIWVSHMRESQMGSADTPNLTVFSEETLAVVGEPVRAGIFAGLPTVIEREVWVGGGGLTQASIHVFDIATAQRLSDAPMLPDDRFGTWAPVLVDDTLWFTASAPNIGTIGEVIDREPLPVNIYPFDLTTHQWRMDDIITLPDMVGPPQWDGRYLWYGAQGFGVVVTREEILNSTGILAVDPAQGVIIGQWQPCISLTPFDIAGDFIYAGCLGEADNLLFVIDSRNLSRTRTYAGVGVNPSRPLLHEGVIWITFKDSNSVAALDYATGTLLAVFAVGVSPQAPVVYQGEVWVYNSGDGVLQRIALPR